MEPTIYQAYADPLLALEVRPAFGKPCLIYRLFASDLEKSAYTLSRWENPTFWNDDWPLLEAEYNTRFPVEARRVEELFEVLRYTSLPLLTPALDYQWRDGIVKTLTIYHPNLCRSQYRWNALPPEWNNLEEIAACIEGWAQ